MKQSIQLTQLELVLLELVAKGKGKWSWYELANALSRRDVPREPDMMEVLKKLAAEGLLRRDVEKGSPRDRWELTLIGTTILKEAQQEDKKKILNIRRSSSSKLRRNSGKLNNKTERKPSVTVLLNDGSRYSVSLTHEVQSCSLSI
ncbi:MAG TPA: hypothetical protein V6D33_13840 [Cyanophyceae cyanobacterium]